MKESFLTQIDVSIMGQSYRLSCKEGEEKALQRAADYLDSKMCAIRDGARIKGTDRIAVMAALSMTTELLAVKSPDGPMAGMSLADVKQKLDSMHATLDNALTPQENLF